jgi:hypothetical protein
MQELSVQVTKIVPVDIAFWTFSCFAACDKNLFRVIPNKTSKYGEGAMARSVTICHLDSSFTHILQRLNKYARAAVAEKVCELTGLGGNIGIMMLWCYQKVIDKDVGLP